MPMQHRVVHVAAILAWLAACWGALAAAQGPEIAGICVTPHRVSSEMRWRRPGPEGLAARVELLVGNGGDTPIAVTRDAPWRFDGRTAGDLVAEGAWAWHDSPESWREDAVEIAPGQLLAVEFNGMSSAWGVDTVHTLDAGGGAAPLEIALARPQAWLSAVTFLADAGNTTVDGAIEADHMVVHVRNDGPAAIAVESASIWLPASAGGGRVFRRDRSFNGDELSGFGGVRTVPAGSAGGFTLGCGRLPRVHCLVEVVVRGAGGTTATLWSRLKIRPESFDIGGGWIASDIGGRSSLTLEPYRRTLRRMHVNTGNIEEVPGYTDDPDVYRRHPFKRFNRLGDLARYDQDAMLPWIHAVEFIGEPQYGGGKPVAPQEVWRQLAPYRDSRLHTSVTLSEERTWRFYAGLSDHPHYDAYRVIAPAADAWSRYDRWEDGPIRWGSPLETIGEMTRSLGVQSRPRAIAIWSQGAHDGWGGLFAPRRASPTPDELRAQAWHGLANRVTSLYWFNLSLPSLVAFPDLIDPITRVDREVRMLDQLSLRGVAFDHARVEAAGRPDWETNVVAAPEAALLVVHDVGYRPDPRERVFRFTRRGGEWAFPVPAWLGDDLDVFAVDADGVRDVRHEVAAGRVRVVDEVHVVGIYCATPDRRLRTRLADRHAGLLDAERAEGFDPAGNTADLDTLRRLLTPAR